MVRMPWSDFLLLKALIKGFRLKIGLFLLTISLFESNRNSLTKWTAWIIRNRHWIAWRLSSHEIGWISYRLKNKESCKFLKGLVLSYCRIKRLYTTTRKSFINFEYCLKMLNSCLFVIIVIIVVDFLSWPFFFVSTMQDQTIKWINEPKRQA